MRERLLALKVRLQAIGARLRSGTERIPPLRRPWLLMSSLVVGFLAVVALQLHPPDPESRLPDSYRLSALIARQQRENQTQSQQVDALRAQLEDQRNSILSQQAGLADRTASLSDAATQAGTVGVRGIGFVVTLDDSSLDQAPTGNVNDLVIHSQDVQAVVNAMWAAGAEAISINGQRVVATSAILCVGNTLLLNGTVHSPPYEISGVGVDRSIFQADGLVTQLRRDADRFSLRFSIGHDQTLDIPPYSGPTVPHYAQVAPDSATKATQ